MLPLYKSSLTIVPPRGSFSAFASSYDARSAASTAEISFVSVGAEVTVFYFSIAGARTGLLPG
jgi:hypothetical protein